MTLLEVCREHFGFINFDPCRLNEILVRDIPDFAAHCRRKEPDIRAAIVVFADGDFFV